MVVFSVSPSWPLPRTQSYAGDPVANDPMALKRVARLSFSLVGVSGWSCLDMASGIAGSRKAACQLKFNCPKSLPRTPYSIPRMVTLSGNCYRGPLCSSLTAISTRKFDLSLSPPRRRRNHFLVSMICAHNPKEGQSLLNVLVCDCEGAREVSTSFYLLVMAKFVDKGIPVGGRTSDRSMWHDAHGSPAFLRALKF